MNINYTLTFTLDSLNETHSIFLSSTVTMLAVTGVDSDLVASLEDDESVEAAAPTDTTPTVEDAVAAAAKYRPITLDLGDGYEAHRRPSPFSTKEEQEAIDRFENRRVNCPKCKARVGEPCTTKTGKPHGNSFYHYDRMVAWNKKRTGA